MKKEADRMSGRRAVPPVCFANGRGMDGCFLRKKGIDFSYTGNYTVNIKIKRLLNHFK